MSLNRDMTEKGERMERELRGQTSFSNRNDYAVALILLKRSPEAISLLQELEREKPGDYFIAANLGTAYELAGDNQQALHWIQEAIRRDPKSHDGTEWLHVKILEAKIAHAKDSNYFRHASVLNVDSTAVRSDADSMTIGTERFTAKEVKRAIEYQLRERLQFVKDPDPPIASLLFDYGLMIASTGTVEGAAELLKMALQYSYPPERIDPLLREYERIVRKAKIRQRLFYASIVAALTLLVIYAVKRRWIHLSKRHMQADKLGHAA
jgi:tetratricopeptide (TPR) repeat protein